MQVPRHTIGAVTNYPDYKGTDFILSTVPLVSKKNNRVPLRSHTEHATPKPFAATAQVQQLAAAPLRGTNIEYEHVPQSVVLPQRTAVDWDQAAMLAAIKGIRPPFAPVAR